MKFLRRLFSRNRKIEVFSRHCFFSAASNHKERIPGFSKRKCYQNLIETMDEKKANITFFLDTAKQGERESFLPKEKTIEINEGTEAGSFLRMIEYVISQKFHPDTICYFVEDDYIHKAFWVDVLLEGFSVEEANYVTLYDHRDKYFSPMYKELKSSLFVTPSCHWRQTPSTTQTFATRFKTLKKDLEVHQKYSLGRQISQDHEKFLELGKRGSVILSSIPGFSTHAEPEFASPGTDWVSMLTKEFV